MAGETRAFEAMVVPRGARIIVGDGNRIELDVQGDLILQESQQGLTSLTSQHGSILIDEGVTVRSSQIRAEHLIRIRGRLETDNIRAASISVEGGALRCGEIQTRTLNSRESELEVRAIGAERVSINGGSVEIGKIEAKTLQLENKVRGAILITAAEDRRVDDTVQVKGGFESDIELMGYLLKYRHQVMSDKVLHELKSRKEGREFQRFLLRERETGDKSVAAAEEAKPEAEEPLPVEPVTVEPLPVESMDIGEAEEVEVEAEQAEPAPEEAVEPEIVMDEFPEATPGDVVDRMTRLEAELSETIEDLDEAPDGLRLIVACLRERDFNNFKTSYSRWMEQLEPNRGALTVRTLEVLERIADFLAGAGN
ncbi:MAG TPA: hypothetical protein VMX35_08720 [Acidobacteriota bacterium]|nr:hypothetical protein [Acidobacteriota bacterium]